MPRDRFKVISRCVTFDEIESRETRKESDPKFFKMRSLFDMFRKNIRSALIPGYMVTVDEIL